MLAGQQAGRREQAIDNDRNQPGRMPALADTEGEEKQER